MRQMMKTVCLGLLVATTSLSFADPSYVQALPIANPVTQVQKAVNQTNQSGADAFGQVMNHVQNIHKPVQKTQKTDTNQAPASSAMDESAQGTLLLSRVMQVNQDFLNFQSKTEDQINQLQSDNQKLSQQESSLAAQLAMVQTKIDGAVQQVSQENQVSKPQAMDSVSTIEQNIGTIPFYIIVGIFILLVVIIILLLLPKKKPAVELAKPDVKSDYDYLSTKEAIPAKLDLARSYIVMEDFEAAKKVLEEVQKEGDDKQKALAADLLKECEPKKSDD
jgi:FimV-like protein